ncbi:MAG: efflux RND transporter permease subunit [Armatimonadetes bacterium]|nr:efflux RND transporter permease subunit [Armatimonadota bacterium]
MNQNNSLTRLSFRFKPVTYLLTALLMVVGIVGLLSMSRREDPDLKGRFGQIIALYPGATAAQVEDLVTERIERTLREVDDIGDVESVSRPGIAVVAFEASDNMTGTLDKMMDDVRERMNDVRADVPSGVTAISVNDRFTDTSALIIGVTNPAMTDAQRETIAKQLRDRLRVLPEVAEAKLVGDQTETITVALSSPKIAQYNGAVTPDTVANALSQNNVLSGSGGSARTGDARLNLAPTGEFRTEDDLRAVIVGATDGGLPIYLRDVATVTRGYADPSPTRLRVSGNDAVAVSVTMRKGKNISALGEEAKQVIADLQKVVPSGTAITTVNDLPRSVEGRIEGFFHELCLAVVIIFAVMFLFMGWRSALLVGAVLPVSLIATFAAMWLTGRDIQQLSIAALIIALALVVDNAIVVLDNIEEKMAIGDTGREEAAISGTEALTAPLITSNMVAILGFLPLAFLPGGVGDFVRDLGLVTSLSLAVSVLVNVTLTPLLCASFLRAGHEEKKTPVQKWLDGVIANLRDGKAGLAQWSLKRPALVVAIAVLAFVGSVSLIPRLGFAFFPPAERDQFVIDVWLPEGRDIVATGDAVRVVENLLLKEKKEKNVRSFVAYIGQGGPRFYYNITPEAPAANYAQIVVNSASLDATDELVPRLQKTLRAATPQARVVVKKLEQGSPVGAPIAVRITGDDTQILRKLSADVRRVVAGTPGAVSVYEDYAERPLRLRVAVDDDRAAPLGITSASVARQVRLAFSGETATFLRDGDEQIPVDLRLETSERDATDLLDLYVAGNSVTVPLRSIATVSLAPEDARIVRRNAQHTLTVFAYSDGSRLASAVQADAQKSLAKLNVPDGYQVSFGGESEKSGDSFAQLLTVFAVAFVFNIVILTVQFNNAAIVAAVLSAVPLGVIGAIPGLFLAHQNFGFMAFLGIMALGGLVTNHTIYIFHYALEEAHEQGLTMADALIAASRRRLRPILLTVLLSVGALLPQAFSGSRLFPPLDWAIIAGLTVSTFLTMIVVPSVYILLRGKQTESVPPGNEGFPLER